MINHFSVLFTYMYNLGLFLEIKLYICSIYVVLLFVSMIHVHMELIMKLEILSTKHDVDQSFMFCPTC